MGTEHDQTPARRLRGPVKEIEPLMILQNMQAAEDMLATGLAYEM